MYHDEKLINGVLHWRGTPNGKWIIYTLEQLSERAVQAETEAMRLREHERLHSCLGDDCMCYLEAK